jgi:hypothetical protein
MKAWTLVIDDGGCSVDQCQIVGAPQELEGFCRPALTGLQADSIRRQRARVSKVALWVAGELN